MSEIIIGSKVKTKDGREWRVALIASDGVCTLKSLDENNSECVRTTPKSELASL